MSDFPAVPYPWQRPAWQSFTERLAAGRLPHALMLAGPPGIGKRHLARSMAQGLLCRTPEAGLACGQCHSCRLTRAGTHPDWLTVAPEEPGKLIRVDEVRRLSEFLGKTSQQGGYKLVVLEPAEAMNANAANALLKGLEEPAANTLLIVVSDNPGQVMATVKSRCQLLSMPAPAAADVLPWLTPLVPSGGPTASELLSMARGAPLNALALLEGDTLERREKWLTGLEQLTRGELPPVALARQWSGEDLPDALGWLLDWLHQLARWRAGGESLAPGSDTRQRLAGLSASLLHRYIERVLIARRQLNSGANPNKQLLLEELLLSWEAVARRA